MSGSFCLSVAASWEWQYESGASSAAGSAERRVPGGEACGHYQGFRTGLGYLPLGQWCFTGEGEKLMISKEQKLKSPKYIFILSKNKKTKTLIFNHSDRCLVPFGGGTEAQRKQLTQCHTANEWCGLERAQQQRADPVAMLVLF